MEILPFLILPFLASLILTGIHSYLGVHVVERGVIFVDLALAQIAVVTRVHYILATHPTLKRKQRQNEQRQQADPPVTQRGKGERT